MARLVDLSHEIAAGLVTYPGLPAPVVTDFLTREASEGHYAPGTTFHIARLEMVSNTGTYVEHLCGLGQLPAAGFRFHCVPVKFRGVGTFPVRAYAVVP